MRVVTVNPIEPRGDRLVDAVTALESGGLVALPTETFYGLAADAADPVALARVNRLKGKNDDSPVLLLLADAAQVDLVAESLPAEFGQLARMFWPGPLTLVVPARSDLPQAVSGTRRTVAVRVPGLALPRRLASRLGRPISGVSANVSGQPPCRTALEVASAFSGGIEIILDGGPAAGGAPSTIVDLSRGRPIVLREGLLPSSALRPFLPDLEGASV